MKELRTYHCNVCGAFLFVGDVHSCDPERVAIVNRITIFLSRPHEQHSRTDGEEFEESPDLYKDFINLNG
jgi:hypothetical protein